MTSLPADGQYQVYEEAAQRIAQLLACVSPEIGDLMILRAQSIAEVERDLRKAEMADVASR